MTTRFLLLAGILATANAVAADPAWTYRLAGDGTISDRASAVLGSDDATFLVGTVSRVEQGPDGDVYVPHGFLTRNDKSSGAQIWKREILPAELNSLGLNCSVLVEIPTTLDLAVGCGSGTDGYGVFVFNRDGNPLWSSVKGVFDQGQDSFGGLSVDAAGRLFLVGTNRFGSTSIVRVHSFEATGQPRWNAEYGGPESVAAASAAASDELAGW